jgi:uncharacterized protein YkwD
MMINSKSAGLFFLLFLPSVFLSHTPQSSQKVTAQKLPEEKEIEKKIFLLVNAEREKRNIPKLEFSEILNKLAKGHSSDMAEQEENTHLSSSGEGYTERLVREGIYFITNGENVAVSDTFSAEIIHQSLMESKGHRENILNPDFDLVGIGVIYKKGRGYYITQDFLQSPYDPFGRRRKIKKSTKNDVSEKISSGNFFYHSNISI